MPENPLISVTLTHQQWNALLDSIQRGTLPRYVGSREAFQSIQMQILRIRYPQKQVKHYADCHWIKKVAFKVKQKESKSAGQIEKECKNCGWRDEVSAAKVKCPACSNRIRKTQELKECSACGWAGKIAIDRRQCPKCRKMRVLT